MKIIKSPQSVVVTVLASISVSTLALAQSDDLIVVTASRLPEIQLETLSTVEIITSDEQERRQQIRLQDALNNLSGVISTSTAGQAGQTGTLIVRGLPTRYNQISLDGVLISDPINSDTYGNILGNLTFSPTESVELSKGKQSLIHGGGAIGGVIGIQSSFSSGPPQFSLRQELGSFSHVNTQFSSSGGTGDFSYYLNGNTSTVDQDLSSAEAFTVDNDQLSLGVKYQLTEEHSLKFTGRYGRYDLENDTESFLTDLDLYSLQWNYLGDRLQIASVLGYYDQGFNGEQAFGRSSSGYEKISLTLDAEYRFYDWFKARYGADLSHNEFSVLNTVDPAPRADSFQNYGLYGQYIFSYKGLELALGSRVDFNSAFTEDLFSYDFLLRYNLPETGLGVYLKGNHGTRAPSILEFEAFPGLFGPQNANPNLEAETVTTVEVGLDYALENHLFRLSAYGHFLEDAISQQFDFDPATYVFSSVFENSDQSTEIYGVEASLKGQLAGNFHYNLTWNYSARNELLTLPRNTVSADLHYTQDNFTAGVGATHRSRATFDIPGGGFSTPTDSHIIARIYGSYLIDEHFQIHGRVENILDEEYNTNPFGDIPGAGTSVVVGLTASF